MSMQNWRPAPEHLILYAARQYNVLTITSRCNVHCVFCSHGQNPESVITYYVENPSLEKIKEWAEYLDEKKKIIIGESATKICEGEPLTHPRIREILQYLRQRFPQTPLQLTTNGVLLDDRMVALLRELAPVELYLSINSVTPQGRRKLMSVPATSGLELLERVAGANVPYHGSIVAMPWLVGWEDVECTVEALAAHGAKTIRIFLPGFSRLAPSRLRFSPHFWDELNRFVAELKKRISTPITLEPPRISDLRGEIGGVIAGSPAARAGLKTGDVIEKIHGQEVFSRVDAFYQLLEAQEAPLELVRGSEKLKVLLKKAKGEPSGVVMDYDLSPQEVKDLVGEMRRHQACSPLILASVAGYPVLKEGLKKLDLDIRWDMVAVPNHYFGGSIISAGLLVVEDFIHAWHDLDERLKKDCDLLILPAKAFDHQGRDLAGRSYLELVQVTGKPVTIV